MIKIEDFQRLELFIGEVISSLDNKVAIKCRGESFEVVTDARVRQGDKVLIVKRGQSIEIPLINNQVIQPEKDIKEGSRVR